MGAIIEARRECSHKSNNIPFYFLQCPTESKLFDLQSYILISNL